MKTKLFLIGIFLSALSYAACRMDHSLGVTYEIKTPSKYTGNTFGCDNRLFLVGDIICMCFPRDIRSDTNMQIKKEQVKLKMIVRNAYVHKRWFRKMMWAASLYTLTPPEKVLVDTLIITYQFRQKEKKDVLLRMNNKRCLIGVDRYYFIEKGSLSSDFWKGANASVISPYPMYSLDSMLSYDSVFKTWKKECLYLQNRL